MLQRALVLSVLALTIGGIAPWHAAAAPAGVDTAFFQTVWDRTVRFRLKLIRGNMAELNAHIQAARGNPAVIGGPRHGDGVLIIIVWANANPDEK